MDRDGIQVGRERVEAATILWAASWWSPISASRTTPRSLSPATRPASATAALPRCRGWRRWRSSRVAPSPKNILRETARLPQRPFHYLDKGQLATIGRSKAIVEIGRLRLFGGFFAWLTWLVVHIYYLIGFENRLSVTLRWAWSFFNFRCGARLIINTEWRFYPPDSGGNQP